MTAPAATGRIEALLDPVSVTTERDQWMSALRLAQQRIQRDPGNA